MHKVILIDDEPLARQLVKALLQSYPEFEVVAECGDGFDGFKMIQEQNPDLIFLDVQMPRLNGFEMLELIENPPAVIFATAFDEYAIKAFEAHAVDYLLKPFSKERFDKAIQNWLAQSNHQQQKLATESLLQSANELPHQSDRIVVKTGGKIKIIPISEVHYIEAADDYVKINTKEGAFLKSKTMG